MSVQDNQNSKQRISETVYRLLILLSVSVFFLLFRPSIFLFSSFYRAMLCIRGTSHGPVSVSVRLSVRLSQVRVLLKRLNVGSHKQHHTIAQGL